MQISRLAYLLSDIVAEFVLMDGLLFINTLERTTDQLATEIGTYTSPRDAQFWINIVPLSEAISEIVQADWNLDDPGVDEFLGLYATAWGHQINARYPEIRVTIETWKEEDTGDVGLRVLQAI